MTKGLFLSGSGLNMNNVSLPCSPEYHDPRNPIILTVHDQIASLSYQYMRMMLIMSAIAFIYVVFNYLFRFDNPITQRIGRAFDAGMIVISSFMLVVSIIYFTGWM